MHLFALAFLTACGLSETPSPLDAGPSVDPRPPVAREVTAIPLGRRTADADVLDLPASNRPEGAPAPEAFGLVGPLVLDGTRDGVRVFRTPLPIHSDLMPTKLKGTHLFGSAAPPGLTVSAPNGPYRFERLGRGSHAYGFDRDWLYLGVGGGAEPPDYKDITLTFDRATRFENGLNRATSEATDAAFVARTFTLNEVSVSGLYLPAPGTARWTVVVPEAAVLTTRATVLSPAVRTAETSDGAIAILELLDGDTVVAEQTASVGVGVWTELRWDVSAQAGRELQVQIRTLPGENSLYDYVFLEEPTLYTPSDHPARTVLVFVDTLRPDHMGVYGYARATTPFIDRWARHGAVLEEARSVAPWTLPSARAALSGSQPEAWYAVDNIAEQFADAGYATEGVVANAFLSQPFDMHRGWTRYEYQHLWPASGVARAGLEALARYPDRDLLLMVHFMDPHLPYEEGWSYRYRWAAWLAPDGHEPARARLYGSHPSKAEQDYVQARYDQNIRMVDDQLQAVLDAAGVDATAILFSDHGEEFWEHGSYEHGHSLYDEVLRVPLVIRGPNVPTGRFTTPVSLLDVTPTALALAGLPVSEGPGMSMVPLFYGDAEAEYAFESRPQAFGRPLYEQDGWAVLRDGKKWIDRSGVRELYDLEKDRPELDDVAAFSELEPFRDALGEALEREVVQVWRVRPKVRQAKGGFSLRISHPDGILDAWKSYDPRGRAADTTVQVVNGEVLVMTPRDAEEPPNAIFVIPNGEWADPGGLTLHAGAVALPDLEAVAEDKRIPNGPQRNVLISVGERGWSFLVDTATVPVHTGDEVSGFHEDVEAQLRELGYLDD